MQDLAHSAVPGSAEDAALLDAATRRARDGFEFYFDRYRMIEARRDGRIRSWCCMRWSTSSTARRSSSSPGT
ncbi:hypothetical protein H1235_17220 [Pseudoxanthomonas sp. NC8]|nr:hypothetical protein H1235_17220 [Pseudoxanthomonas sp. NC8]